MTCQKFIHYFPKIFFSFLFVTSCSSSPKPLAPFEETSRTTKVAQAPAPSPTPTAAMNYWQGRKDLIPPPPFRPASALPLPSIQRFQLKNGLSVVLLPDHRLPLVDMQLLVRVGAIDAPAEKVGLADFVAGMLRHGTRRMDADTISEKVDSAGISLGAGSGYELSQVSCHGRNVSTDLCLQMVADLAIQPTFPAKEMDEIREKLMTAVKEVRDDPGTLAELHFNNLLYGDERPAGQPMTIESVQSITREDLQQFYRKHFTPQQAILGVSGDFQPAPLQAKIERAFGSWAKRNPPPRNVTPVEEPPAGLHVLLIDNPDLSQSFFHLGHAGISRLAPDRDAVMVMNYVLGGGGFSSRLMQVVRANGGKTYGIKSNFEEAEVDGSFSVYSFTRNEQFLDTLRLVQRELEKIKKDPPTKQEILAAKGDLAGGYALRLQTPAQLTARLIRAQIWGLPDSFVTDFPVRIDRIIQEQAAQAARKHIHPEHLVMAVVGKAAVVAPQLRQAKIPFEQISYLSPISAAQRKREQAQAMVKITVAEQQAARQILTRVLTAAGGEKRFAQVHSLRLSGKATVEEMEGTYQTLILLPDHLRQVFDIKPSPIVQVLDGNKGVIQIGKEKRELPPELLERMKGLIWREPILLPLHALQPNVQSRLSTDPRLQQDQTRVAIDLIPPDTAPCTIVIQRKTWRIERIQHKDLSGQLRRSDLSDYKKVSPGIWAPFQRTDTIDGRRQVVRLSKVEINPKIEKQDITRE